MSFFGQKKKQVLGVDIGFGGIKLVELKSEKGRPALHTYAYTERSPQMAEQNILDDPSSAAELFKRMMKEARTTTSRAVAGLPIASVFSSIISVPFGSGQVLREAIVGQAAKLIPLPLEEMVLDWKILDDAKKSASERGLIERREVKPIFAKPEKTARPEPGKKILRILLTSAAKKLIRNYTEFGKLVGLELLALETEAFALIRSLVGKDSSSVMIIDFGTVRTSIVVVLAGIPVLTRTITLGGATVTRAISQTLGIPVPQAEQMKRDLRRLTQSPADKEGEIPAVMVKAIEPLITEIRFSLNLFRTQQGESRPSVEKIILTGGSASVPYLANFISQSLNMNTYVADPWARVGTHDDLRPVLDEIGPRFAVAIGLAMREFE
ncbi:pilus assembly protein PilM [Candidatus Uhrbacteria bacterium]|nr:pilus assembly protein PilM [Candidatus Uhrbacteria bacterium]